MQVASSVVELYKKAFAGANTGYDLCEVLSCSFNEGKQSSSVLHSCDILLFWYSLSNGEDIAIRSYFKIEKF